MLTVFIARFESSIRIRSHAAVEPLRRQFEKASPRSEDAFSILARMAGPRGPSCGPISSCSTSMAKWSERITSAPASVKTAAETRCREPSAQFAPGSFAAAFKRRPASRFRTAPRPTTGVRKARKARRANARRSPGKSDFESKIRNRDENPSVARQISARRSGQSEKASSPRGDAFSSRSRSCLLAAS